MRLKSIFLLFLLGGFFSGSMVSAQLVGTSCYLQGHWLEIGMLPNASFGASAPPAGYHPYPAGTNLAETYDVGHDGWTTGTPNFNGDYTYPGSPFEGWELQVAGLSNQAFAPGSGYSGSGSLTGSITSYTNSGGRIIGNWSGTASSGGLIVRQETRVDTEASWVVVTTFFKNITAAPIADVYYMRSCDPDNDEAHGGATYFSTTNTIVNQNDVDHRVQVDAEGGLYSDHFALCTKDYRAKCLIYTSWPLGGSIDLSTLYDGTYGGAGSAEYIVHNNLNGDYGIGLVYKVGTIAPGDSAIISYAYIFNGITGVDSAFPEPELWVDGSFIPPSGDAPAPTIDTFKACDHPGVTSFVVDIKKAADKCWTWSKWTWAPAAGLATTTGLTNTITIGATPSTITTYTITGTDSATGMNSGAHRVFYLTVIKCFNATNNSDPNALCASQTLELKANGDSLGATYQWYGPAPVPGPGLGPLIGTTQYLYIPGVTTAYNGVFTVIRTVGSHTDTAITTVTIKPLPVVSAGSNGPLCSGNTLNLSSTVDLAGETWSWTGPMGFASSASDPSRPAALTGYSGIYKVVTGLNGCFDSAYVTVAVDSTPELPVLSVDTLICSGDTLKLHSTEGTAGVTYLWHGPNFFTSTKANPTIANVTTLATGVYTLDVTLDACTSTNTINVLVRPTPVPALGSNSPVCSGTTLNLTSTGAPGSLFDWAGPNSFTSAAQNPSITPVTTAATGVYTVVVTLSNCPSDPVTIYAEVDTTPEVPAVSTNSPGAGPSICQGDTLLLFATSATAGSSYQWAGPNSFTSAVQNPVIYGALPAATGVYTVTASIGACSTSATIIASVTPTPPLTLSSNSPICSGEKDTVYLYATSGPTAVYSWTGPYSFASLAQNPYRTPAVTEYGGVYVVTVLMNGCTNTVSMNVEVRQTPPAPWVKWISYCQYYDAPALQAYGLAGSTIHWYESSAGGVNVLTPPVPQTTTPGWTFYYVNQTVGDCPGPIDSIKVQVNPKPTVTTKDVHLSVCPRDSLVLSASSPDPIAYFRWKPYMYITDTTSPATVIRPETDLTYSVVVTNQYGCMDTATIDVVVHPGAVIFMPESAQLFPGETYQMDPKTNCTSVRWSPAGGLSANYIPNPIASPVVSTKYYLTGTTEWGCKAVDSIDLIVNPDAQLALPNAFAPGNGPNGKFKLLKRGIASLRHFRIYDRWGVMVFEAKNIDDGWDGTYNGAPQPLGVYIYEVDAVSSTSGHEFVQRGNVTLLR